jgi:hypothetical protein
MKKPVLLRELVTGGELDIHLARLDAGETRAERPHETLAVEAAANAALELGVLRLVARHAPAVWRHVTHTAAAPKSTASRRSHEPYRC